jgi:hypothetical protein
MVLRVLLGQRPKAHEDSCKEDWECVIFSNESSVEKTEDPRKIWVFRTAVEERHKECVYSRGCEGTVIEIDCRGMYLGAFDSHL